MILSELELAGCLPLAPVILTTTTSPSISIDPPAATNVITTPSFTSMPSSAPSVITNSAGNTTMLASPCPLPPTGEYHQARRSFRDTLMVGVDVPECPPQPLIYPPWELTDLLGHEPNSAWELAILVYDALGDGPFEEAWELDKLDILEELMSIARAGEPDEGVPGVVPECAAPDLQEGLEAMGSIGVSDVCASTTGDLGLEKMFVVHILSGGREEQVDFGGIAEVAGSVVPDGIAMSVNWVYNYLT